eukprot:scaffold4850_cov136-Isochrysis_galbana.AAC.2
MPPWDECAPTAHGERIKARQPDAAYDARAYAHQRAPRQINILAAPTLLIFTGAPAGTPRRVRRICSRIQRGPIRKRRRRAAGAVPVGAGGATPSAGRRRQLSGLVATSRVLPARGARSCGGRGGAAHSQTGVARSRAQP